MVCLAKDSSLSLGSSGNTAVETPFSSGNRNWSGFGIIGRPTLDLPVCIQIGVPKAPQFSVVIDTSSSRASRSAHRRGIVGDWGRCGVTSPTPTLSNDVY